MICGGAQLPPSPFNFCRLVWRGRVRHHSDIGEIGVTCVDHRHAILRGKPQLAIARLHASRPIAAVRFHVQHAIAPAIRQGRNRIPRAGGELVQLPLTHPLDAAVAAHPKVAMRILENLKDAVIEQPFAHAIAGKLAVFEAAQAAVVASDPDDASLSS